MVASTREVYIVVGCMNVQPGDSPSLCIIVSKEIFHLLRVSTAMLHERG